jgi:hypothetical protein
MSYDEIMMKYVEGKIMPGLEWVIKNLENDVEVIAGASEIKERLRKFLQGVSDEFEEYVQAGGLDDRDNQDDADVFGDDDIVVSPDSESDEFGGGMFNDDDDGDDDSGGPFGLGGGDFNGGG